MPYSTYSSRETIETRGKTTLYSDNSQQLFIQKDGNNIYFKLPSGYPQASITKGFWGADTWDFFGAEEEGDYIKLAIRSRIDNYNHNDQYKYNFHIFQIFTFDQEGMFISVEVNKEGDGYLETTKRDDLARIKELFGEPLTKLEEWAWKDSELMNEYFNTEIENMWFDNNNHNPNGRLEEWAYYKYQELYPERPILEGFGVKEEKKTNDGDGFNQDKIYAPSKFKKKSADKITNFNPSTDTLEIDTDSFGIDGSATFTAGKNKKKVKKKLANQDFDFLYDQKKGGLYFNENGAYKGFGDGGIIAIIKGCPDLTANNLEFI